MVGVSSSTVGLAQKGGGAETLKRRGAPESQAPSPGCGQESAGLQGASQGQEVRISLPQELSGVRDSPSPRVEGTPSRGHRGQGRPRPPRTSIPPQTPHPLGPSSGRGSGCDCDPSPWPQPSGWEGMSWDTGLTHGFHRRHSPGGGLEWPEAPPEAWRHHRLTPEGPVREVCRDRRSPAPAVGSGRLAPAPRGPGVSACGARRVLSRSCWLGESEAGPFPSLGASM